MNSIRHGAYSTRDIAISAGAFSEDTAQLNQHIEMIVNGLLPRTPVERMMAHEIAVLYVRIDRVHAFEAAALSETGPRNRRRREHGKRLDLVASARRAVDVAGDTSRATASLVRQLTALMQLYDAQQRRPTSDGNISLDNLPDDSTPAQKLAYARLVVGVAEEAAAKVAAKEGQAAPFKVVFADPDGHPADAASPDEHEASDDPDDVDDSAATPHEVDNGKGTTSHGVAGGGEHLDPGPGQQSRFDDETADGIETRNEPNTRTGKRPHPGNGR